MGAIGFGGFPILAADRSHVVWSERGDALYMRHFGSAPHWAAMTPGNAVAAIDEVEMCIEMDDVNRLFVGVRRDCRHGDGVIAAKNIGHRRGIEKCENRELRICQTTLGVGVDD